MLVTESLQITPAILKLIAEIDEFKGAWLALGRLAPERLESLRHVATIESVASSTRIEGSQLTDLEVEALLSNVRVESLTSRDAQEVAGYASVMQQVFESFQHMPVTENLIRQLHRDLLAHSDKDHRHRGNYKTIPNSIEAFDAQGQAVGVIFQTASPFDTPPRMTELIDWYNDAGRDDLLHPLLAIAIFTVVFLEIHPFQDGNGRLSRVMTTLLLLKAGYSYVPYSSLESVIEQYKDRYYVALRRTQQTIRTDAPDWQPWIMFFLTSLQRQKNRLQTKVERERILFGAMPELSVQILEVVREHGRATLADMVHLTGGNRNSIKRHVRMLVEQNHLKLHGAGRGAWYSRA